MKAETSQHGKNLAWPRILACAVLFAACAHAAEPDRTPADAGGIQTTKPYGRMPLLLSMKLSIPGSGPTQPGNSTSNVEALRADSVAKQDKLQELNVQIAEMERMIREQQSQLGNGSSGSNAAPTMQTAPGMSQVSGAIAVADAQSKPKIAVPAVNQAGKGAVNPVELLNRDWIKPAIGVALVLIAVPGLVWYRRRKSAPQWNRSSYHDPSDVHDPELVLPTDAAHAAAPMHESTIKIQVIDDKLFQSILPPEYEMLEEADIYLRFGHDKLAEEVLRDAIKISPKNPQTYLRLLRIYFAHENSAAFLAEAQHLKLLGDEIAWSKAAEMGHSLDPGNPFYQ